MMVQVYQPLWGGFPKHWAYGPVKNFKLVNNQSLGANYSENDAKKIAAELNRDYPNAEVKIT